MCFVLEKENEQWLHHDYLIVLVSNDETNWISNGICGCLGRLGLGIAIAGGVVNSMLYNGKR